MARQVLLFRNNHPPQGNYYLIAEDKETAMRECDLSWYMVYMGPVNLRMVCEHLDRIPLKNGDGYYESMAKASIHSAPDVCNKCCNRICGRPAKPD